MRRHLARAAAAAALMVTTVTARAAEQPAMVGTTRDNWPTEITKRPLTLAQGMFEIAAPVQFNASEDADWKPITLNPSVAFGITDRWMLGVRHFVGVCFGGADNGCAHVYNDVSAYTRIAFARTHGVDLAVQGAFNVAPLTDNEAYSAEAGLLARFGGGALALTVQPTVSFGLNDRDTLRSRTTPIPWNFGTYDIITPTSTQTVGGAIVGNKEHLSVPATLQLQLGPAFALAAGASLEAPLNPEVGSFSDYYQIPIGFAAVFTPARHIDIGASFTFPNLAGKNNTSDTRQLAAFLALRI
jgi:hypothetical protein